MYFCCQVHECKSRTVFDAIKRSNHELFIFDRYTAEYFGKDVDFGAYSKEFTEGFGLQKDLVGISIMEVVFPGKFYVAAPLNNSRSKVFV